MPQTDPVALAISRVADQGTLSADQSEAAFAQIMRGEATAVQIAALLAALRVRGENAEEVAGAVRALRGAMVTVPAPDARTVDTCGTGGGTTMTFNISTAAAFVVAACGVPVAKHGNRSFTSRSGSADVLEALGTVIPQNGAEAAAQLDRCGMTFLFAPLFHPAMKHVGPIRRELGIPTIMNMLGPLANPAGVRRQFVGVADPERAALIAQALALLGSQHALVVHARVGMDEIAPSGLTDVWEVRDGTVQQTVFDPGPMGLTAGTPEDLAGGTPAENADIIRRILEGRDQSARRSAVILNAAGALVVSGAAQDWKAGVKMAATALDSAGAANVLKKLVSTS